MNETAYNKDEIMFNEMHEFIYNDIIEILKTSYNNFKKNGIGDPENALQFVISDSCKNVLKELYLFKLSYHGGYNILDTAPNYDQILGIQSEDLLLIPGDAFDNKTYQPEKINTIITFCHPDDLIENRLNELVDTIRNCHNIQNVLFITTKWSAEGVKAISEQFNEVRNSGHFFPVFILITQLGASEILPIERHYRDGCFPY